MLSHFKDKELKELEEIVQNRFFYLKRINFFYDIAFNNLIEIGKRSYGGIFHDARERFDLDNRQKEIKKYFIDKINERFSFEDKELFPKHQNKKDKYDFKLSINYYEDLFAKELIKIKSYLDKGVDTKVHYSFFDEYVDAKGQEKHTSYKLLPEPFRSLQIRLIYFYRFLMIKLKRRTHFRTGKHEFYKTYNEYSNHKKMIFERSQTMSVAALKKEVFQIHISLNEVEVDRFLNQLEDAIRSSYNSAHISIMHDFKKQAYEAYEKDRPYIAFLYNWEDPEEKLSLPRMENIDI